MKEEKKKKFGDYYGQLILAEKLQIRNAIVPQYMQLPTFYKKLARNGFTVLELEKITEITGVSFLK